MWLVVPMWSMLVPSPLQVRAHRLCASSVRLAQPRAIPPPLALRKDGQGLGPGELRPARGTLLILDETDLEVEALDAKAIASRAGGLGNRIK